MERDRRQNLAWREHVHFENTTVHLWCAYPADVLADESACAWISILSKDERRRWETLAVAELRAEYLTSRALVRTALSHYHSTLPGSWRFTQNMYGKPFTNPECGLEFNLSNCRGLVVCLVAKGSEVGVDVESHKRAVRISELASDVFSQSEISQLESLDRLARTDRCLSLWTLKEAYVKALGLGLHLPFNEFSFLFSRTQDICLELESRFDNKPRKWWSCQLDHMGHRIAMVVDSIAPPTLQFWEACPFSVAPKRILQSNAPVFVEWMRALSGT